MFVNHGLIIDYNIEIQDYVFERFGSTYGIRSHQNIIIEFIRMCKYCGMDVETNDMFMTASTYNLNPNQTPLQNLFITEQIFTEEIIREKRKLSLNFKW